jgi:hypothetical protein
MSQTMKEMSGLMAKAKMSAVQTKKMQERMEAMHNKMEMMEKPETKKNK